MEADELKNKLHKYIDEANEEALKEVLAFFEEDSEEYAVAEKARLVSQGWSRAGVLQLPQTSADAGL